MPQTHQVRRARVAESRCYDCGKITDGEWRCDACRARVNEARNARSHAGLCYNSAEPSGGTYYCQPCAEHKNELRRLRRARQAVAA